MIRTVFRGAVGERRLTKSETKDDLCILRMCTHVSKEYIYLWSQTAEVESLNKIMWTRTPRSVQASLLV